MLGSTVPFKRAGSTGLHGAAALIVLVTVAMIVPLGIRATNAARLALDFIYFQF